MMEQRKTSRIRYRYDQYITNAYRRCCITKSSLRSSSRLLFTYRFLKITDAQQPTIYECPLDIKSDSMTTKDQLTSTSPWLSSRQDRCDERTDYVYIYSWLSLYLRVSFFQSNLSLARHIIPVMSPSTDNKRGSEITIVYTLQKGGNPVYYCNYATTMLCNGIVNSVNAVCEQCAAKGLH